MEVAEREAVRGGGTAGRWRARPLHLLPINRMRSEEWDTFISSAVELSGANEAKHKH